MADRLIREILQRVTRIETRFTRYMTDRGFETGAEKPRFSAENVIVVPSRDVRLSDILDIIPISMSEQEIPVFIKGNERIATIVRGIDYDN